MRRGIRRLQAGDKLVYLSQKAEKRLQAGDRPKKPRNGAHGWRQWVEIGRERPRRRAEADVSWASTGIKAGGKLASELASELGTERGALLAATSDERTKARRIWAQFALRVSEAEISDVQTELMLENGSLTLPPGGCSLEERQRRRREARRKS